MLFRTKEQRAEQMMRKAERSLALYRQRWMAMDGVVACGIGLRTTKDPTSVVIKIYVRKSGLPSLRSLPRKVDGIPIVLEEAGEIRSLQK
jgi:hypothetical protein